MRGLVEYLELWDALIDFQLNNSVDQHHWKFESSGTFSSQSAYRAFFIGSIQFEPWKRLWKSWAPTNARSSFAWLFAIAVGQLIASKKGDSHIQPSVLSVTRKAKQHNTSSHRACSPGNSGQAFFNL